MKKGTSILCFSKFSQRNESYCLTDNCLSKYENWQDWYWNWEEWEFENANYKPTNFTSIFFQNHLLKKFPLLYDLNSLNDKILEFLELKWRQIFLSSNKKCIINEVL